MAQHYVTLKDVAMRAGTTAATVSYVLNEKEGRYISKEMRERVMNAVHELGYVKSSAASSLRGKNRGIIAVLVPQFDNQFFTRIALAVETVAYKKNYILSICNTFDDPQRERAIINRMMQQRVDGYIISPTPDGRQNTSQLRQLDVPMVVVDRSLAGCFDYPWVTFNNYKCALMATEHLLEMGHKEIALIDWDSGISDLDERKTGFTDALKSQNITNPVIRRDKDRSENMGYEMTRSILQTYPNLTAIFYACNSHAKGGIRCLREMGRIIGEDISVVLIGSPEWVTAGNNDFSHIEQHEYQMGETAANLLLKLIESPHTSAQKITIDCTLYKGTSVKNRKTASENYQY